MSKLSPKIDNPWDLTLAVSLVVLALAIGFLAVPTPRPVDPTVALKKSLQTSQAATTKAGALAAAGRARVVNRTWSLGPEAMGVQVLGAVTRAAERRHLEVSNFTVGRTIEAVGLRQIPFAVTLAGPFPDVLAAMAELEKPTSKLVVGGVKLTPNATVSTTDEIGTVGRVTATLALTAFLREGGA